MTTRFLSREDLKILCMHLLTERQNRAFASEYAEKLYRIQLRAIAVMTECLMGFPTIDELLSVRIRNMKINFLDMNCGLKYVPPPIIGFNGVGPHATLNFLVKDRTGKIVNYSGVSHNDVYKCPLSAFVDIMVFRYHTDNLDDRWRKDPQDPSPYLFHNLRENYTTLPIKDVERDIFAAMAALGHKPDIDLIRESAMHNIVKEGFDRDDVMSRALAPPLPSDPKVLHHL